MIRPTLLSIVASCLTALLVLACTVQPSPVGPTLADSEQSQPLLRKAQSKRPQGFSVSYIRNPRPGVVGWSDIFIDTYYLSEPFQETSPAVVNNQYQISAMNLSRTQGKFWAEIDYDTYFLFGGSAESTLYQDAQGLTWSRVAAGTGLRIFDQFHVPLRSNIYVPGTTRKLVLSSTPDGQGGLNFNGVLHYKLQNVNTGQVLAEDYLQGPSSPPLDFSQRVSLTQSTTYDLWVWLEKPASVTDSSLGINHPLYLQDTRDKIRPYYDIQLHALSEREITSSDDFRFNIEMDPDIQTKAPEMAETGVWLFDSNWNEYGELPNLRGVGSREVIWNGKDSAGQPLPLGDYILLIGQASELYRNGRELIVHLVPGGAGSPSPQPCTASWGPECSCPVGQTCTVLENTPDGGQRFCSIQSQELGSETQTCFPCGPGQSVVLENGQFSRCSEGVVNVPSGGGPGSASAPFGIKGMYAATRSALQCNY